MAGASYFISWGTGTANRLLRTKKIREPYWVWRYSVGRAQANGVYSRASKETEYGHAEMAYRFLPEVLEGN